MKGNRIRSRIVPAVLAAGLVISFYDVVFQGRTIVTTEFVAGTSPTGVGSFGYQGVRPTGQPVLDVAGPAYLHQPDARLARRMVRKGELFLWNPHTACGMPFLAEMASALLYPFQWVLLVSDAPWVWDAFMLGRLLLAGLFTALYLRGQGVGSLGTLLGAYGYMLCGFHVWYLNTVFLNSTLLLPLVLWAAEKVLRSPSWVAVGWLALAVALEILSGAPEPAALALVAVAAYVVYRLITLPEARRLFWPRLGRCAAAGLLGLGLSAPVWLSFVAWLPHTYHVHAQSLGRGSIPVGDVSALIAPESLGPIWRHWDGGSSAAAPGYAGAIVILLVLLAFLNGTARHRPWAFFAGAAGISILKIYGFPGLNWAIGSLPLFDRAYVTAFLGPVLLLSLSLLAGASIETMIRTGGARLRAASAGTLLLLALLFWGHSHSAAGHLATPVLWKGMLPAAILVLIVLVLSEGLRRGHVGARGIACCLVGLLAVDLFIPIPRSRPQRSDPFAEPPYVGKLKEYGSDAPIRVLGTAGILFPNAAQAYRIDDVGGTSPIFVGRYVEWMREMMGAPTGTLYSISSREIPSLDVPGMDLLGMKYLITPTDSPIDIEPGAKAGGRGVGGAARGEILAGEEVGQTFVSTQGGLSAVSVALSLFSRVNRGALELRLYEGMPEDPPLRFVSTRMEDLKENAFHIVRFEPVVDSRGKLYSFTLSSPDASRGNAVTPWICLDDGYLEGYRLEGGQPAVRDLVFTAYFVPWRERYDLVYDEEVRIFENRRALPRAYVVPGAEWVREEKEVFPRLRAEGFDPRRTVILEGEPGNAREPRADWRADGSRARIIEYGANRVRITVDAEAPGYLVLLDTYSPGWRATVGGEDRTIHPANGLFRAVRVGEGRQVVEFRYRPFSFRIGVVLAALAAAVLGGLLLRERLLGGVRPVEGEG